MGKKVSNKYFYPIETKNIPIPVLVDENQDEKPDGKSGFDSIRGIACEDLEVKFISRQPTPYVPEKWCRRIDSMTEELSKPSCWKPKVKNIVDDGKE